MAAALGRLGFEVTVARDAGRTALNVALRAFTRRSAGADVAVVFYAGHAMEMDGVNYLLPVDARIEQDTDVRYETVTLGDVLASTSGAGLRVVILDACRNNPLARSMQRTVSTRSVSNGSLGDLNEDLLGDETLVAYSAAAGTTAADGDGRNSPYTTALLAHLEEPVDIGVMFRRVRARVLSATNERQRPHEYSSLLREHYLSATVQAEALWTGASPRPAPVTAPAGAVDPSAVVAGGLPDLMRAQQETVFWQSIEDSMNAADFEAYVARWPNGVYVALARNRLSALRPAVADPPRLDPPRLDPPRLDPPRLDPPAPASARPDPAATAPPAGETFRDCPSCPEMVVIPAGTFRMGSPASEEGRYDDEGPQHRVTVQSFALGRYEVTREEYSAFAAATGHDVSGGCFTLGAEDNGSGRRTIWSLDSRASWREPGFAQGANAPVTCVSWRDAKAYVAWLRRETGLSYRLPSEAEWEYAARAGTTTRWYWGNGSGARCDYANGQDAAYKRYLEERFGGNWNTADDCTDGASGTASVGEYGANDFRLFDMLGNVGEWMEDCWHDSYRGAPSDGTAWMDGGNCGRSVLRGGSWNSDPRFLRSAARFWYITELRYINVGFRVARTLD